MSWSSVIKCLVASLVVLFLAVLRILIVEMSVVLQCVVVYGCDLCLVTIRFQLGAIEAAMLYSEAVKASVLRSQFRVVNVLVAVSNGLASGQ